MQARRVVAVAVLFAVALACSAGPGPGGSGGGSGAGGGAGGGSREPQAGDPCSGDWSCVSGDTTKLLACEPHDLGDGGGSVLCGVFADCRHFAAYTCRGPNGCTTNGSRTLCDFRGSIPGDACPELARGSGFCSDGGLTMCGDGGWAERPCANCREQNGQIFCG
jgi:hypothetical protein